VANRFRRGGEVEERRRGARSGGRLCASLSAVSASDEDAVSPEEVQRLGAEAGLSEVAVRRALVELPRDHGKSVQVCIRVLWELGRRPSFNG